MGLGKDVKLVSVQEWDELVEKTYGRPYSFQQQDGCKDRGIFKFSTPVNLDWLNIQEESMNDWNPMISDMDVMGVKFDIWLVECPSSNVSTKERLFWKRRFYPNIYSVIDDLYNKGLIEKGEYVIDIDW